MLPPRVTPSFGAPYRPPDAPASAPPNSAAGRAADPTAPTAADVRGAARLVQWLWRWWPQGVTGLVGLLVGVRARPEYLQAALGGGPVVAVADSLAALQAVYTVRWRVIDSQLRALRVTDDSLRTAAGAQHRAYLERMTALGAGLCVLIPAQRREEARLPCTDLLQGRPWRLEPLP